MVCLAARVMAYLLESQVEHRFVGTLDLSSLSIMRVSLSRDFFSQSEDATNSLFIMSHCIKPGHA